MTKKVLFLLSVWLLSASVWSQVININLSHYGGREYVYYVMQGIKQDTLLRGALDKNGQAILKLPETYKNYVGVSKFFLPQEGGALDIILNGEPSVQVNMATAKPSIEDIHYIGSAENNFLFEHYQQQQKLMEKASVIDAALQVYTKKEALFRSFEKEKAALQTQFASLQRSIAQSPLYAARIFQMTNYLNNVGSRLDLSWEEVEAEQKAYFLVNLDFAQLYTSGLWGSVLPKWIEDAIHRSDSALVAESKTMIARTGNETTRQALLKAMIQLYNQYGKENLLTQLDVEGFLSPGHTAPMLQLQSEKIQPRNSLVIFYETGCNHCENELTQLQGNYPSLKEKGIRVISIAADHDEATFNQNANKFPWSDNFCDYKGFEGENFRNYNVMGTPTIFVIDNNGIIIGRYARLADVGLTELQF